MSFPGRIYIARGPWHFGDYRNIFLPNIGENQKKVLPSELEDPGGSTTFRHGRLGVADYAPGLLGAWTFMRRDF